MTLRSPCDSLMRRSRLTLLSRSVDQRSRLAVGKETPHALELDRSTPEDYERLKLLNACLIQQIFSIGPAALSVGQDPTPTSAGIHYG
jgi:hypothetical protein